MRSALLAAALAAAISLAPAASAAASDHLAGCPSIVAVRVAKSARTLSVECSDGTRQEMTAGFGRIREGAKQHRGDGRTPVGSYHVAAQPRASRYHRFILIDYPSTRDADRALADGRINAAQHRRIVEAHEAGALPPQDTPLGGHVGIHGEGAEWRDASELIDWTLGCIAVSDVDVEFLAERLAPGIPVHILP